MSITRRGALAGLANAGTNITISVKQAHTFGLTRPCGPRLQMKLMPTDDAALGKGRIREDERKLHTAYLFEVKAPGPNKGEWDFCNLLDTIPAEKAFRPMADGGCPLVKS